MLSPGMFLTCRDGLHPIGITTGSSENKASGRCVGGLLETPRDAVTRLGQRSKASQEQC